ncbi:hypothetical protein GCM10023152_08140 [Agromyces bauzanensis]|uniref:Uncharacterized protein n=1 Tax=Agromyces bauzanensis TaxID=1308924 RepID=A0A917UUR0_9MICO|nr:hypothetical protein GCM10011372_27460 [Agromyces bauzanensis]
MSGAAGMIPSLAACRRTIMSTIRTCRVIPIDFDFGFSGDGTWSKAISHQRDPGYIDLPDGCISELRHEIARDLALV